MAEINGIAKPDYGVLQNKKILVAEDVKLNQDLVKHILQTRNIDVTIVENGLEALNQVRMNYFDCVLMDVHMPEMDGIEATKRIRLLEDKDKSKIPIIALTAELPDAGEKKFFDAGMDSCLAKPYDEFNLLNVIVKYVQNHNLKTSSSHMENFVKTETAAVTANKLYSLAMVESVSGGDKEFTKKMISLFIETVPADVKQLQIAAITQNWIQVGKIAHKLKSTIDSMAIKNIQQDIRTIELNAKQESSHEIIPPLIEKVNQTINTCIKQLQMEFD
jgi:CheY-like chemotaxis protein